MPEISLQGPRINALVRKGVATGVAKLVGMDLKLKPGNPASASDKLLEAASVKGAPGSVSLAGDRSKAECRGRGRDTAWQLPQSCGFASGRPSHHRNEIPLMRSAHFCGGAATFSAIRRHNERQGNSLQGRL